MKYDFEDLPKLGLGLMLAAIFFVVAIIILSALGDNSNFVQSTTLVNESFTMPEAGGSITLAEGYVTSVTSVANTTGTVYPAVNYTLSNTLVSTGGVVTFVENATVCKTGATCRITYVYNDHTTASGTTITNSISAISEIPNNWLLLMVIVLIAAIIIGIVVANLNGGKLGRD